MIAGTKRQGGNKIRHLDEQIKRALLHSR